MRNRILTSVICVAGASVITAPISAADTGELKVARFHVPNSFDETLEKIDEDNLITVTDEEWFPPSSADFWVVFSSSSSDRVALPEVANEVLDAISESPNPLVRVSVGLANGLSVRIQINDLNKTVNSVEFQGCVSALDVASVAYQTDFLTPATVDQFCIDY